jgi:hypothetical protein
MPTWHIVGDLTDPNLNPDGLPAEITARLYADAQEAAEREAADTAQTTALASEAASRTAAAGYTHLQSVPASVWLIEHHLGYDPGGVVVMANGVMYDEFGVHYVIPGQTIILSFDIALAGAANLS